jgi:LysM repeat protein
MAGRSPARFLAPLALVAFSVALFTVVSSGLRDENEAGPNQATESQPASSPNGDDEESGRERLGPRFYRVKAGDTPSAIADKTGTSLEDILRLNPDLDPQTLSPGTRIRLRR